MNVPCQSPLLNDLLTSSLGHPQTIVNEGIGCTVSAQGVTIISTLLAQHERSQHFLVQYGINGTSNFMPVQSGKGLTPAASDYPGTFKDNMQQIIDEVQAMGKDIVLAKPPIALGNSSTGAQFGDINADSRNVLIRKYADVIDELIADPSNNIIITAPDCYQYFSEIDPATGNRRYIDQYSDNLHPNGTGYQSMAELWYQQLMEGI
jgi:lysophospholipase L1-like esterase